MKFSFLEMKKLAIVFGLIMTVMSYNCVNQAKGATLELNVTNDTISKRPRYELTFLENGKIVAKAIYQNGKTILLKGEIPKEITNVVTVKLIRPDNSESKVNRRGIVYSKNGKMLAKRIFENGKTISVGEIPEGLILEKYEDGKIKNIFIHHDGKRNGPALGLYPSGNMKLEVIYKDDYPDGIGRRFFENGSLMVESKMVNRKNIYYKDYYENGQLKHEVYYKGN